MGPYLQYEHTDFINLFHESSVAMQPLLLVCKVYHELHLRLSSTSYSPSFLTCSRATERQAHISTVWSTKVLPKIYKKRLLKIFQVLTVVLNYKPRIILHCIVLLYICFTFFLLFMFTSSCSVTAKHNKRIYTSMLVFYVSIFYLPCIWWIKLCVFVSARRVCSADGRSGSVVRPGRPGAWDGTGHRTTAGRLYRDVADW